MVPDVLDSERSRLANQQPEDSAAEGQRPDRSTVFRRESCCDELHQLASITDHAECSVSGIRHLGSKVHDALEHHR
jgi:hypothetical protein